MRRMAVKNKDEHNTSVTPRNVTAKTICTCKPALDKRVYIPIPVIQ